MRRLLSSVVLAALALPVYAADGAAVDTSGWVCEYCPFAEGTSGTIDAGAASVSGDAARLGNATGLDEEGLYPNLDAQGLRVDGDYRLRWNIEDLGLDSRVINVDGGRTGLFDYHVDWSELPYRRFFTTETVFADGSDGSLELPADWVRAPTTSGFTALDGNLSRRNIESDRRTLALGGAYAITPDLRLSADYRQRTNEGVRVFGGSTYTNASQLPARFDHTTDEVELSLRYGGDQSFVGLSWYLSDFDNRFDALTWQQPFATAPGADQGQLARAPDNRFQQLRLSGGYAFSEWRTVVSLSAALGQIEQDAAFLPYTLNGDLGAGVPPQAGLNGEVDTRNLVLAVSARPLRKVRLRASYRYDERDNNTPVALYERVIADTFLSGEAEANVPFGYRRRKLAATADWDALRILRLTSGFEFKSHDRTLQEVSNQEEFLSFGRARLRPLRGIEVDARYGNSRREIDNYDESLAIALGQNPLMRKYNLAYRFREFVDVRASWSPATLPLALTVTGLFADDNYTQSQLGLTSGEEQSFSGDLSWMINERASLFINAGVDNLQARQAGSEAFAAPDWIATNDDTFTTWGAGFTVDEIAGKVDLRVSALTSRGESEIAIDSLASGADQFPDLETDLDRLRLDATYHHSDRMDFTFSATYQRFQASDWALQGVGPATAPQLFSLGARPYDEDNVILLFGVRFLGAEP